VHIDPSTVVIPDEKVAGYLLSSTHPIGRYKSAFFLGLGYTPTESALLAADLLALLFAHGELGEVTEYGQKVLSRGSIMGPSGQVGRVMAVWIILSGESRIRFVTAYPEG
jgi:hypothetical protein